MQNALARGLVDGGNGGDDSLVGVGGARGDGGLCLLDNCFQVGLDGLVVGGLFGGLTHTVFLGFNVWHNATVPLLGFGHLLAQGVVDAVERHGLLGALTGGFSAAAGGIAASLVCGVIASLLSRSKDQS